MATSGDSKLTASGEMSRTLGLAGGSYMFCIVVVFVEHARLFVWCGSLWLVGWLVGWVGGWLVAWLVGWLGGWLVGWLVGVVVFRGAVGLWVICCLCSFSILKS